MMKTLNDYFTMNYRMEIVEDKDEGGFVVSFRSSRDVLPAEKQQNPLSQTLQMPRKHGQKLLWKMVLKSMSRTAQRIILDSFKLRIPRSLSSFHFAEHSKKEGISMNQYCVYLLSRNDAVYSKLQTKLKQGVFCYVFLIGEG